MNNTSKLQNKKILIVDQNFAHLYLFREMLSKAGFQVMTAKDRETAAKLLSVSNFDYLITNLKPGNENDRPGEDGTLNLVTQIVSGKKL